MVDGANKVNDALKVHYYLVVQEWLCWEYLLPYSLYFVTKIWAKVTKQLLNSFSNFRILIYVRAFSGFSVGSCINEEKVIFYQLELGNNLPTFRLNAPVVTFALMATAAFSHVAKLFSKLKLVPYSTYYPPVMHYPLAPFFSQRLCGRVFLVSAHPLPLYTVTTTAGK